MTERPILFSTPMVLSLRSNHKTVTRRTRGLEKINEDDPGAWTLDRSDDGWFLFTKPSEPFGGQPTLQVQSIRCPYGIASDRLWTRERWAAGKCADGYKPRELAPRIWKVDNGGLWYFADNAEPTHPISPRGKWRSSLFMPRWASRDTLEVTEVRVERVSQITMDDCFAEGIAGQFPDNNPIDAFHALWDSINGTGSWAESPWVWVVSFQRIAQ